MVDGVKEFHLTAEPVKREFASGMIVTVGVNGQTPARRWKPVEGDRVRILVTNHLPGTDFGSLARIHFAETEWMASAA